MNGNAHRVIRGEAPALRLHGEMYREFSTTLPQTGDAIHAPAATNPSTAISKTQGRAHRGKLRARGVPEKEAAARAWATVNKESGGGNKSGSGRAVPDTNVSSKKGGKKGGAASAARPAAERSASAKKAAATRKRNKSAKS